MALHNTWTEVGAWLAMDASLSEALSRHYDMVIAGVILVFTLGGLLFYGPQNKGADETQTCDKAVQSRLTTETDVQTRLTRDSLEMLPRLKSNLARSILHGVLPPGGAPLANGQGDCNTPPFGTRARIFDEIHSSQLECGVMKNILALMTAKQIKSGWDAADTWCRWQVAEKYLAGTRSEKAALKEKLQRHGVSPTEEGMPWRARDFTFRHIGNKAKPSNLGRRCPTNSNAVVQDVASKFLTDNGRPLHCEDLKIAT
ncbi:hypothetical protein LSAT2_009130 [Lamellibrachia satsuma]|nr:hypothetical protein LSAT2_009130 [Lamellibrachia satsuma]